MVKIYHSIRDAKRDKVLRYYCIPSPCEFAVFTENWAKKLSLDLIRGVRNEKLSEIEVVITVLDTNDGDLVKFYRFNYSSIQ